MSIFPKKYHTFISPPLRRVFLDAREDNSRAVIEKLNAETAALNRDKVLLMDRCDSAQSAVTRLLTLLIYFFIVVSMKLY
jgi:hypothetical protein